MNEMSYLVHPFEPSELSAAVLKHPVGAASLLTKVWLSAGGEQRALGSLTAEVGLTEEDAEQEVMRIRLLAVVLLDIVLADPTL